MSSIDPSRYFEESCSRHNQPLETKVCNDTNNIFNFCHSIDNMPILMRNESSHTSIHSIHSLHVDYEGYEIQMNFQGNEIQSSIMLPSPFLELISESNHIINIKILSLYSFHKIFAHNPHQIGYSSKNSFKQSCVGNCTYQHWIGDWLEQSYRKKFPENGKIILILFVNKDQEGKYNVFLLYFEVL